MSKSKITSTKIKYFSLANLFLYGLVTIVSSSLLITGGILIWLNSRVHFRHLREIKKQQAEIVAGEIETHLDDLQRELKYLEKVRGLTNLPPDVQRNILEGLTRHNYAYEEVAIVNREGEILASISPYKENNTITDDNSSLLPYLKYQSNHISPVTINPKTNQPVITIVTLIKNLEDQVDGVLVAKVNLDFLNFVVSQSDLGNTGYTYIVDERNLVLARTKSPGEVTQEISLEDISERPFLKHLRGKPEENLAIYEGLRGVEVLGASTKVHSVNWRVVVELPTAEAYSHMGYLVMFMGVVLFISIAIAAGLGIIVARWIVTPLGCLVNAATEISQGNFHIRVEIPENLIYGKGKFSSEIAILAQAFNKMIERLSKSFDTLAAANQSLEKRVKKRTAALNEAKIAADRANQAKSDFLASVSHELRTPLNGILGYAQILNRSDLQGKERRGIEIIHQCGNHLLTLINDILDIAKIEAGKMELSYSEFHFPSFIQGVGEICQIRAQTQGIEFYYQTASDLPVGIYADEKRLRQVLLNLLGNAIKFTKKGGVTFRVEVLRRQEAGGRGQEAEFTTIRFQIEDTGIGIPQEVIERIFQPFEQVKGTLHQTEGTGLGLAISTQIVTLMESKIHVTSQLGEGSTFWFDLDLIEGQNWVEKATISEQGKIIGYQGEKRKILMIDDRWENRSVIVDILQPLGFEVIEAANGKEGMCFALAHKPDLIITDLAMPVMNGYEMLKELRWLDAGKEMLVIVSSASVLAIDRQKSITAGGNDFLPKPVQTRELFDKLQHHLQLTWVYEEDENPLPSPEKSLPESTTEIASPPREDLEILLDLAKQGLVHDLLVQADRIEQLADKYTPFAQELRQLSKTFQINQINQLLEDLLVEVHS